MRRRGGFSLICLNKDYEFILLQGTLRWLYEYIAKLSVGGRGPTMRA